MNILKIVCYVVGTAQIALGLLYLLAPAFFLNWQGLTVSAENINYPLAMFAARLLVYGVGMFVIAGNAVQHRFWLDGMIAMQVIDLAAGLFYTYTGVVNIMVSGFPMFNALLIIVLLTWLRRYAVPGAISSEYRDTVTSNG